MGLLANARFAAGVFLLALGGGCAIVVPQSEGLREAWPAGLPERTELADVPFFPQEEYQCGPAALAMVTVHSGANVTPQELAPQVYIPARKGSLQVEMLAAPRRQSLVSYSLAPHIEEVLREVASGTPVVVLHGYGIWPVNFWHYSVVVGFDRARGEVLLRSGTRQRQAMPFAVLEYTWKDSGRWAMVAARPDTIPATATEAGYLDAIHAMARVGGAQAANAAYAAFLRRWPGNLAASVGLANSLHALGHLDLAETVLRDVLKRDAGSVVVMNNLAQTLSDQGRNSEALALIDEALKIGGPLTGAMEETRRSILQMRDVTHL